MENKRFLTANDVAQYMGISDLQNHSSFKQRTVAARYIIVSGCISRSYFEKNTYGGIA